MSRSGYSEDCEDLNLWRGAVESAIRGKRGQAFLKEMLAALDSLERKELIDGSLEFEGAVCALGAVGRARGIAMAGIDAYDHEKLAATFGISRAMAQEIMFMNDDDFGRSDLDSAARFARIRAWVVNNIAAP